MADIVLAFAEGISENFGNLAGQYMQYVLCLKNESRRFTNTLSCVRAALADVEEQREMSHADKDWLEKLRDVLYDADDLVDDFATESRQKKQAIRRKLVRKISHLFSTVRFSISMAFQLKEIRDRLDDIAADRSKFHSSNGTNILVKRKEMTQTHSYVFEPGVVGRDGDKMKIREMIKSVSNEDDITVIPITGIGGVGKTTLAQSIYNDEVTKPFDLKMWVWLSENFDVEVVLRKLIESVTHSKYENFDLEVLQTLFREEIAGRRYFLVLDDMWNDNRETWQKFRELLLGGGRGCTVIVTTRMEVVATITGTPGLTYELQRLPEDMSWSMFRQIAYKPGQENPRLLAIGKEIVKKCAGNPLAIRTVGSLLYCMDTEDEWLSFQCEKSLKIPRNEHVDVLDVLKSSYDHLPSFLKPCFAYCSLFPKGYLIDKDVLIKLWMAQGFIQSFDGNQCLHNVGNEYFLYLCRRSLFHVVKDEYLGKTVFKIDDLFHDLAKLVAGTDMSVADLDPENVVERSHHVSFSLPVDPSWEVPTCLSDMPKIRTFLLPIQPKASPHYRISLSACEAIFSRLKCLRTLDLNNLWLRELPSSIGELRHLRYLDLCHNICLLFLPSSITKLQNLQTLRLSYCESLQELPANISKMTSLQHIEIDGCSSLTQMPPNFGQLTCLQTLTRFIMGRENTSSAGLGDLKNLTNLRGCIAVEGLGLSRGATTKVADCFKGKEHLQWLALKWGHPFDGDCDDDELLLEGLEPHQNLKKLEIYGYNGAHFPSWMIVNAINFSLPNLVELKMENCGTCRHLPSLRWLPSVQVLHLKHMASLEYVEDNFIDIAYGNSSTRPVSSLAGSEGLRAFFPSLKELYLEFLPKLKGWSKGTEATLTATKLQEQSSNGNNLPSQMLVNWFPCLSKSTIRYCPSLTFMPPLPCIEQLELVGISRKFIEHLLLRRQEPMMRLLITNTDALVSSSSLSCALLSLSKLKYLHISTSEDIHSLPECIGNLPSLQELDIFDCPNLASLPEGIRHLTMLQKLSFDLCSDLLYERCRKEIGEDWPKIAHIPDIKIQPFRGWSQR